MLRYLYISSLIVIMTIQTFAQHRWVPFLQQTKTEPTVTLASSNNNNVSFNIKVNGMLVTDRIVGETTYQQLSIPNAEVKRQEGLPQVPMITKLIAIPDCDNVSISVGYSNKLSFEKYNVLPSPRFEKKKSPDGTDVSTEVFEENKTKYSSNADFPGKYGEILETGYVRGQKVARVAIYPVQFNPVTKTASAFTDFNISLSFINPSSPVNKELGIFRNMMHHAALNYELNGISASTKITGTAQSNSLSKASLTSVTSGSVTMVADLTTLVGTNAKPVDYLIITHSSLFNLTALSTLANYRCSHNGFDVAVVQVDGSGQSGIYTVVNSSNQIKYPSTSTTRYISIRNFIADVYLHGKANHTGNRYLGYILLVGDALKDDNLTVMVPASYAYHDYGLLDPNTSKIIEILDAASDYYYACTGGDGDNFQDVMYGRLPVGNETELSNNVNKIISYESNTNGSWCDKSTFVAFSPDIFSDADPAIKQLTEIIPPTYPKSYAYRAYPLPSSGQNITSPASVVTDANPKFPQRFTSAQYASQDNCGADLLNNWVYNEPTAGLNNGIHTFVYEGHAGPFGFGAEGCGRQILALTDCNGGTNNTIYTQLNNNLYTFMIFNCCQSGYFDTTKDCEAEAFVNIANKGAIGVLASARSSSASGFGLVDGKVLDAMYNNLSHVMGEAIMESKLNIADVLFRRQYNLYGDPAVNLWPIGYTITENDTLSGIVDITNNITVASGVALIILPNTYLRFANGTSLIVNGTLKAQGTLYTPITFTSTTGITPGSWNYVQVNNGNSVFKYCTFQYGTNPLYLNYASSGNPVVIENCIFQNNSNYGLKIYGSNAKVKSCEMKNNVYDGVICYNNPNIKFIGNNIHNNSRHGIYCMSGNFLEFYGNVIISNGSNGLNTAGTNHIHLGQPNVWEGFNTISGNVADEVYVGSGGSSLSIEMARASIHDSTQYDVYNTAGNPQVYTTYCYWGVNTRTLFSGPITLNNPQYSIPTDWDGKPRTAGSPLGKVAELAITDSIPWIMDPRIPDAEKIKRCKEIIAKDYKSEEASTALDWLYSIIRTDYVEDNLGEKKTFVDYLQKLKTKSGETKIGRHALRFMIIWRMLENNSAAVIKLSQEALKTFTGEERKWVLTDLTYAYLNSGQTQDAKNIIQELRGNYSVDKELIATIDDDITDVEGQMASGLWKLNERTRPAALKVALPEECGLSQNYPNPFNPSTIINYQLKNIGYVTLRVYDLLGREVATLVDGMKEPGYHSAIFEGSRLSSGIYFTRMVVQSQEGKQIVQVRKMLLMK